MNKTHINVLLAGVGGQGILTLSRIISWAAIQAGYIITSAETHGMSQRDGSVTAHLRIGDREVHPLIDKADVLIALEPHEVLRNISHINEHTLVISEKKTLIPPSIYQNRRIEILDSCDGCSICISDSGCPINRNLKSHDGIWIRLPAAELVNGRLVLKEPCTKCGICQEICPTSSVIIEEANYLREIENELGMISKKVYTITASEFAQMIENPRAANIVLFGAFYKLQDKIHLSEEICQEAIQSILPVRTIKTSLKAFQLGQDSVALCPPD